MHRLFQLLFKSPAVFFAIVIGLTPYQTELAGQGVYRHLLWENAHTGEQAEMLAITGWTEKAELNRLLVTSPRGHRLILDHEFRPEEGLTVISLEIEGIPWKARLTDRSDLRMAAGAALDDPFQVIRAWRQEALPIARTLELTDLQPITWTSDTWDELLDHQLFEEMQAQGMAKSALAGMDTAVRKELQFLREIMESDGPGDEALRFKPLLDLLITVLRTEGNPATGPGYGGWSDQPKAASMGRLKYPVEDATVVRFLAPYQTASATDLLDGRPVGEAAPQRQ